MSLYATRIDSRASKAGAVRSRNGARPLRVLAAFDKAVSTPEIKRPERVMEPPKRLFADDTAAPASSAAAPPPPPPSAQHSSGSAPTTASGVTIEYQRQRAKEMTKYFRELKQNESVVSSQVFGWTRSNEISNGRWVMFGLLVGMLTEYATGVDFPDQIKLMCSYLGIVDVE